MTADDVRAAADLITSAKVLICQLEVPVDTTLEAMKCAKNAGGDFVTDNKRCLFLAKPLTTGVMQ